MAPPSPPLPLDALYEVLLRVPAKDLCRLRAVCRPWRALLSDPQFIGAHAACHPEPLIFAAPTDGLAAGHLLDIMDLSGRVIKKVAKPGSLCAGRMEWARTAQLNVVCVVMRDTRSVLLLNPATGAVSSLPQGFAEEHLPLVRKITNYRHIVVVAVGKVASTGEYKVLRVLQGPSIRELLCEVLTLDGSSHARWRRKKTYTEYVDLDWWNRVTINGIVYFLSREFVMDQGVVPLPIASFDLETEEWRPILRAPLNRLAISIRDVSVASLNDCLVVIHYIQQCSSMDLWFLMDFENGLWAKQHSIPLKSGFLYDDIPVQPFLVLNDGRILYYEELKLLRIYDPKTCTSTDVAEIGRYSEIGLYKGNLLSLPDGAGA